MSKASKKNDLLLVAPVPKIIKLLEASQHRFYANGQYADMRTVFEKFLDFAIASLESCPVQQLWDEVNAMIKAGQQPPIEGLEYGILALRYAQMLGKWNKAIEGIGVDALTNFSQILTLLLHRAQTLGEFEDYIGEVYEQLGQASKWHGQYFTPMPVARMTALVTISPEEIEIRAKANEGPLTIHEPACGSGRMFLAAAQVIADYNPALLEQVEFSGVDLDATCVKMSKINLTIHGLCELGRFWKDYWKLLKGQLPQQVEDAAPTATDLEEKEKKAS